MESDALSPTEQATPSPGRPAHKGSRVLFAMLVILLVAVIPGVFLPTLVCREDRNLPDLGQVQAFSLIDQQGQVFTEEALRGHPTIVNFIFTRCDTICPVTSMKMQRLEDKTRDKRGIAIKLLSITVDPAHDTPALLAAFAERYRADPERWRFLTGPVADVFAVVEGSFMTPMTRKGETASGAPNIAHSGLFMLVDGELKIRGLYDSGDIKRLDALMYDARYLARTQRRGFKFGGT